MTSEFIAKSEQLYDKNSRRLLAEFQLPERFMEQFGEDAPPQAEILKGIVKGFLRRSRCSSHPNFRFSQ